MTSERLDPRRALVHPLFWLALVVLVLNDHVWKHGDALPSVLTGKLSDFAGLLVAPAVLAVLLSARSQTAFLAGHLAVGVGFVAINVSEPAARLVVDAVSLVGMEWRIWSDPTDLLALPALWVSHRVLGDVASRPKTLRALWGPALARAGFVAGMVGCIATSRAPPVRVAADQAHVYAPSGNSAQGVVFLDIHTGREVRRSPQFVGGFPRPIAVANTLVASGEGPVVVGVDTKTGAKRFEVAGSTHGLRELLAADGRVVYVRVVPGDSYDIELVGVDAESGQLAWQHPLEDALDTVLHVKDDIILLAEDERLDRLDPATGKPVWTLALPDVAVSMGSMKGRSFVQLDDAMILVLDAASGKVVLRREIEANTWNGWTTQSGSLTASEQAVFLETADGIMVLDEELRLRRVTRDLYRPYVEGDVVVARAHGYAYRLDAATGAILWRQETDFWWDAPTLTEDTVVLAGDDQIVALDARTGKRRWQWIYPHARD